MRALQKKVDDEFPTWKQSLSDTVQDLLARPARSPHVAFRVFFPDAGRSNEGEKYLLYRWLLKRERRHHLVCAYPIWLVVTAADCDVGGWRVVRDNLCPHCGHAVLARDDDVLRTSGGHRPHRWCRELWEEISWVPPSSM